MSEQTNRKSSLLQKIKKLMDNLFHFILRNTPSRHQSNKAISKQVNTPLDLSHEILRFLEHNSTEPKRDPTLLITFLFKEPIYDILTNEPTYLGIYDTPMNNKPVLEEPIYEEIHESIYDTPRNNKPVREEPIYAEIYDVPRNNKPVLDEPIYVEINTPTARVHDQKPMIDIPPPLPPRNW